MKRLIPILLLSAMVAMGTVSCGDRSEIRDLISLLKDRGSGDDDGRHDDGVRCDRECHMKCIRTGRDCGHDCTRDDRPDRCDHDCDRDCSNTDRCDHDCDLHRRGDTDERDSVIRRRP